MSPIDPHTNPAASASEETPGSTSQTTFRLPTELENVEEWHSVLGWAHSQGVIEAVALIVDAGYLAAFTPSNLIHFLNFLRHSRSRHLLAAWRRQEPIAELLALLGEAVVSDDTIFRVADRPSKAVAKEQIRGNSDRLYLLGMLIADPPQSYSTVELANLHQLKLWGMIQLLKQASEEIYQETFMVDLATRLRQCEDPTHAFASEIIREILPDIEDYELVRLRLGQRAEKALNRHRREQEKENAVTRFLRNVIKVAAGETGKKGQGPYSEGGAGWFPLLGGNLSRYQPDLPPPILPDFPGDEEQPVFLPIGEEEDILLIDLSEIITSLAERSQVERDFLAINAEYQQALSCSWHNLNPVERSALDDWIDTTLKSPLLSHRLVASLAWVGRHCARSLKQTEKMGIDPESGAEWKWDPDSGCLHRLPPKRRKAWQPKAHHKPWIVPLAPRLELRLPAAVQNTLLEVHRSFRDVATLGDLCRHAETDPDHLFRKLTKGGDLARVQPGMLAHLLYRESYLATGNALLARLLCANGALGLPGACAYPSFLGSDLHGFFTALDDSQITLGSRLDPVDRLLREAIAKAGRRLEVRRSNGNLIDYHNDLVAYLRQALLAATGMRPLKDLLESPRQIDDQQHFLYVDDKGSAKAPQGRLVPLPEQLATCLLDDYARHLKQLARVLEPQAPQMAREIMTLARGIPSTKLPYLFLLQIQDKKLGWVSASSENIEALELFDWPLPDNLFRHRLGDRLRRQGVHPEIIDGILGHLAHNTGSYGPYSPRIWDRDREQVQPAVESAFADLRFKLPQIGRTLPSIGTEILFEIPLRTGRFGLQARREGRRREKQRAFLAANMTINRLLGPRNLTELQEEEVQDLVRKLCFAPDGEPRPDGLQRFAHFRRRLEAAWRKTGKRVRLGRRSVREGYHEKSLFLPEATQARSRYEALKGQWKGLAEKILRVSRTRHKDAALLASISLCLEHRIANPCLLEKILANEDFRVVIHAQRVYLEYAPGLRKPLERGPVQRIPLREETARLLELAGDQKQPYRLNQPVPSWLKGLVKLLQTQGHLAGQPDIRTFLRALARTVDQVNLQQLPAIQAAVLSGTIATYSLTWADQLRLQQGRPVTIRYQETETEEAGPDRTLLLYGATLREYLEGAAALSNAKVFIDTLRSRLPPATEESQWANRSKRKQLAQRLLKSMQPDAGKVSPAILLLGKWVAHLLLQRASSKRTLLTFNSIRRYLSALSGAFIELGYAFDLANADPESLTEFYKAVLTFKGQDKPGYRAKRLLTFHRWARLEGVDEPDWSELPNFPAIPEVAPGLVTETEYLEIFRRLQNQADIPHELMDAQAFVWLCSRRYGLRDHEALFLKLSDVIRGEEGLPILLVRTNRLRRLKTDSSRRQVPCLHELTGEEQALLERLLPQDKRHHDWESAPYVIGTMWREQRWQVRAGILAAIKVVTGNSDLGIHHGRHSAGSEVALAMYQPPLPDWWAPFRKDAAWEISTRQALLGRQEVTRRSGWAACRYLGHARPSTSIENYWHFLWDAIWQAIPIENRVSRKKWKHAIVLEAHIEPVDPASPVVVEWNHRPATPQRLMDLFWMLANGHMPEQAARVLRMDPHRCAAVNSLLESLGRKMLRGIHGKYGESEWSEHDNPHKGFLQHLKLGGWQRLMNLCQLYPRNGGEQSSPIDQETLDQQIGASRHLLLWEPEHFVRMRAFLEHYRLPPDLYQLIVRAGSDPQIRSLAEAEGFSPVDQRTAAGPRRKTPFQIDTVRLGNSRIDQDRDRCALVVKRNAQHEVHDGYELVALFIAWNLGEAGG